MRVFAVLVSLTIMERYLHVKPHPIIMVCMCLAVAACIWQDVKELQRR